MKLTGLTWGMILEKKKKLFFFSIHVLAVKYDVIIGLNMDLKIIPLSHFMSVYYKKD